MPVHRLVPLACGALVTLSTLAACGSVSATPAEQSTPSRRTEFIPDPSHLDAPAPGAPVPAPCARLDRAAVQKILNAPVGDGVPSDLGTQRECRFAATTKGRTEVVVVFADTNGKLAVPLQLDDPNPDPVPAGAGIRLVGTRRGQPAAVLMTRTDAGWIAIGVTGPKSATVYEQATDDLFASVGAG